MSEVIVTNTCTNPDATWAISGANDTIETSQSTPAFDAQGSVTITLKSDSIPSGLYYKVPFTLNADNQFTIPLPTAPASVSMSMGGPINVSIGDGQG